MPTEISTDLDAGATPPRCQDTTLLWFTVLASSSPGWEPGAVVETRLHHADAPPAPGPPPFDPDATIWDMEDELRAAYANLSARCRAGKREARRRRRVLPRKTLRRRIA